MSLGINTKPSSLSAGSAEREERGPGVVKPIFLSGLGRSGTTIIHTVLSEHPRANWLSLFTAKFPHRPEFNRWLMRAIDIPLLKIPLKMRFVPLENYEFWNHHYGGFFRPCRDLGAGDVTHRARKSLRRTFSQLLTPERDRMLIKTTGMPRIGFLSAVFPDAKFIHVIRDGRAAAHSRMNVGFWRGWEGRLLWPGELPDHCRAEWESYQFSFVALAGIEWKANMDLFEAVKRDYPHLKICEVRYESFCADPVTEIKRMADFAELEWTPAFEASVRQRHVGSENNKWKNDLTEEQQAILNEVLHPYLVRYGYEAGPKADAPRRLAVDRT
jgi:omega-hydroxy-beta-dihydromenaquinone-9 sulfotransferase